MKTTDELVIELADREAIRELPVRYCDCVWRGDVEGIVDLFADDGNFTVLGRRAESSTTGRANLLKSYREGLTSLSPRPYIHNHVVELKGANSASGRCYVELRTAADNMNWIGTGYYHDEYVKVGNQWKFQSRRFTAVRFDEPAKQS
jgi:SnoaL-like domain